MSGVSELIERLHEVGAHYSACDRQQTIYEAASALASQAALITEAREQALEEWRGIETAPMDGTWILLFGGDTDEYTYPDASNGDEKRPVVGAYSAEDNKYGRKGEVKWRYGYWDSAWYSCYINPTHWRPLPAAPRALIPAEAAKEPKP